MREIALDTETTGLEFENGDRIIEIGCVEIIDKIITGNVFHRYVNPKRNVSQVSVDITGLTEEFLNQFEGFDEVANDFLDFVKGDRLVIHNAKFDMAFINGELSLIGISALTQEVVDTLKMVNEKYPGSPSTLDALCRKFAVSTKTRKKHGALIDAKLLAEVYIAMSVEKIQQSIFDTNNNKPQCIKSNELTENYIATIKQDIKTRHFEKNEEDEQKHNEFLKTINNPLWLKWRNNPAKT